jgi:catechol 2,3-dioxygenase-like lactoylglutathione lyase family enzyme
LSGRKASDSFKTRGRQASKIDVRKRKGKEERAVNAKLDLIGIVVDDMARSLAFYRELGLAVPADADERPHVELELPGGLRLAWDSADEIRSFDPDWKPGTGDQRIGLAFLLDSPEAVDRTYERLTSMGHSGRRAPFDAPWGQRYATVDDPDGTGIDLFCPLK